MQAFIAAGECFRTSFAMAFHPPPVAPLRCFAHVMNIALLFISLRNYGFSSRSDANVRSVKGYRGFLAASEKRVDPCDAQQVRRLWA